MTQTLLQGNYIDLIIVAILLYFLSRAWRAGFWIVLSDFFSFVISFVLALYGYQFLAALLVANFTISSALSKALSFFAVAVIAEGILHFIFNKLIVKIPTKYWRNWWSRLLATIPAIGEGLVIASFVVVVLMSAPITPKIKSDLSSSTIGREIIKRTSVVENKLEDVFGEVIEGSLTYLTVESNDYKTVSIDVEIGFLEGDKESEEQMFILINNERIKLGLDELTWREELSPVARTYAQDMWERRYFGHVSPEGEDAGDRLEKVNLDFVIVGENLAIAPTVEIAHDGLMNSKDHKANILGVHFKRVGVGVIDNGVYGKMFVQLFTD